MDIGTAKVSKNEQQRVKHHLIDIVNPDEKYSAGNFIKDASDVILKLHHQQKIPIICGGTGMYIKALTEGLFEHEPIPSTIKDELYEIYCQKGLDTLYDMLKEYDPVSASNIYPQDKQRILRALEVFKATGKPIRAHWDEQQERNPYRVFNILINPDRSELYQRINERMDNMLRIGLIEEIHSLIDMGYNENDFGLNSVGYKEFFPFLNGKASLSICLELAKQHSRNYAKRQITWYKKCNFNFAFLKKYINISEIIHEIECFLEVENV